MLRVIIFFSLCTAFAWGQNAQRYKDSIQHLIRSSNRPDKVAAEKAVLLLKQFTTGDTKLAKRLYKEALQQAITAKADSGLACLYHTYGTLFYYESEFDSALAYYEKALAIRQKIKDDIGILKSTGNIGGIYFMFGQHKKALEYFEAVLKKEEELHFEEGKYISINNLGTVYKSLKFYDKAFYYYKKAEKLYAKKNSSGELIYTYDGMADLYEKRGQLDSAIICSVKAKKYAKDAGDVRSVGFVSVNLAVFYTNLKKYHVAKMHLDTSLTIAQTLGDKRMEMASLGNLASIELKENRADSAMRYVEKIVEFEKKYKVKNEVSGLNEVLAKYYLDKKDFESASFYLQQDLAYRDSIYTLETAKQISEMQAKYETDKKEKQNQLLQHENQTYRSTRNYLLVILATALLGIVGAVFAYRKIKRSKELVTKQKHLLEEKQKEILDSINYAKRIQYALLASDNLLSKHLPAHFVFFKPKDVVSGDFYWATPTNEGFIYVTADCTGHGVPGAFMSLLNISKLSQAINENNILRPDLILNNVRKEIVAALNPEGSQEISKDGMDAVVCKLNRKDMKLQYAAANNSFYIIRKGELLTCQADKMPVGKGHNDDQSFSFNEIELHPGDVVYTFTDGFADQFGGPRGKKFKYKQFEELLVSLHTEPLEIQKQKLDDVFTTWKGKLEQVDDVCVIGIRI